MSENNPEKPPQYLEHILRPDIDIAHEIELTRKASGHYHGDDFVQRIAGQALQMDRSLKDLVR